MCSRIPSVWLWGLSSFYIRLMSESYSSGWCRCIGITIIYWWAWSCALSCLYSLTMVPTSPSGYIIIKSWPFLHALNFISPKNYHWPPVIIIGPQWLSFPAIDPLLSGWPPSVIPVVALASSWRRAGVISFWQYAWCAYLTKNKSAIVNEMMYRYFVPTINL